MTSLHLLFGIVNYELTYQYKGLKVVPEAWRCDRLRHCRYFGDVIEGTPWVLIEDFLVNNKVDFVA